MSIKIRRIKRSIGEMKIKKVKFDGMDSFNDYQVELSYGQLVAIRNALEKSHADPLSDELHAELNYYLQNIPGPGENSEQFKAERDAATKGPEEAGMEVNPDEVGGPPSDTELEAGAAGGGLPAPPTDDMGDMGAPAGEPGKGEPDLQGGGAAPGGDFQEGPKLSPEERDIMDRSMQGGPGARPTGIMHKPLGIRGGGARPQMSRGESLQALPTPPAD